MKAMRSWRTVLVIGLLELYVGSIAGCGGGSGESLAAPPPRTNAETSATPLVPSQTTLDFGIVPQGEERKLYIELTNTIGHAVEIERVESSCDCLRVSLAGSRLDPGKESMICFHLDLAAAREFVGKLVIDVAGYGKDGKSVFSLRVHADMRPVSKFALFGEFKQPQIQKPPMPVPMP